MNAQQLSLSAASLLHLIDDSNDALLVVDEQSRVRLFNRAAESIFGYSAAEMIGGPLAPILPLHAVDAHPEHVSRYLKQNLDTSCGDSCADVTGRRKDGTEFPLRITLTRLPAEKGRLVAATIQDLTQQRLTEEALRIAHLRFSQITENIHEVFYISNLREFKMHYISPGYEGVWGRSCQSLYTDPASFMDAIHTDDRGPVASLLDAQLRGEHTEIEYRIIRPDNEIRWIRDRAYPAVKDDGTVEIVTGVAEDITTIRQYRESILKNQAMITGLYDNIGVMIFIVDVLPDEEYLIAGVNPYYLRQMGLQPAQIIGKTLSELSGSLIPHEAIEDVRAHYRECIRRRAGMQYEESFDIGEHSSAWLTVLQPLEDSEGRIWRIIGTSQDISMLKRVENDLRELNETLELRVRQRTAELEAKTRELQALLDEHTRAETKLHEQAYMLDVITDAVIATDGNGIITYWSKSAEQLYDLAGTETIGRDFNSVVSYTYVDVEDPATVMATVATRGRWRGEVILDHRHGQAITLEVVINGVFDDEPQLIGTVSIVRDVTERSRMEEELRISRDQLGLTNDALNKASRMKDEFLANMSHELRTPLTSIQILSEAMQDGLYGPVNDKQRKSLRTIEESGQHLLSLINDILDLSKIEAGQLTLTIEECDAVDLVMASATFVRQMAERKDISILFNLPQSSVLIEADVRRFKQVLINLLSNAVKFTPNGGKVGVDLIPDPEADAVHFSIWDTGIGIAAEDFPNLFKPFTQLDSSLTRMYAGTGLGLSLVQRMVDLHGGNVTVESTPGAGSRFTVTLPCRLCRSTDIPDQQAAPVDGLAVTEAPSKVTREGALILLAEDNETTLSTLGEFLALLGYRVITAHDGQAAVARAVEERPDLILMDVQMPRLTGLDAIRIIRKHPDPVVATIPIVALTALAMSSDKDRCLAAGASDYLAKPLSMHDLHACVERMLARR